MFVRTAYSHSRLSSYEKCPLQFHYRYIQHIPADSESIEAFMGKRVHEVIERVHLAVAKGNVPPLDQVHKRFQALWDKEYDEQRIRIVRSENPPEFYRESGIRCLNHFYRRDYPFDRDETLAVEERVQFSLDVEDRYRMNGIIDRVVRARDGAIEIHDYKTGRRVPSQSALDRDRQLALYQIGLGERFVSESKEIRLVWDYLLNNTIRISTRSETQLQELRDDTIRLIDQIEDATEFPARPSALCGWCEYRSRCPVGGGREEPAAAKPPPALEPPVATVASDAPEAVAEPGQLALF